MNTLRTLHDTMQALVKTGSLLLQAALVAGILSACSGGGGPAADSSSADPAAAGAQGVGSIQVSGRLSGADVPLTGTPWPAATPDTVTLDIDEVAVSTDGVNYTPVLQGPIQYTLAAADGGILPALQELPAGEYRALRLKVADIAWHATWTLTNPSPCDASASGQAQGTVDLGVNKYLYFMTPSLGGNTLRHYVTKLPFQAPNYMGDINNPLLLAAPLLVSKDNVSTLSLVLGTSGTLTCSTVTTFNDQGLPTLQLSGPVTLLKGADSLYYDSVHDEIAVANTTGNSITVFSRQALTTSSDGNIAPKRYITGPDSRLNRPRGIALYSNDADPTKSEMIVANSGNNSLTMYGITADGDEAPIRTISGSQHTNLNVPVDVALRRGSNTPYDDELWVANNGNDTVTVYAQITPGDAPPLYTLSGTSTGLSNVCGIAFDAPDDDVLVSNSVRPGTSFGRDSVTIYNRSDIMNSIYPPTYTIAGDVTGLNKPCGIAFDADTKQIYVANTGNGTVTVYDWAGLLTAGDSNIAPVRTISGLVSPQGASWDKTHQELFVAQRGQQATMTSLPDISPVTSDTDPTTAPLQGIYNVVVFGVDLSKGVHSVVGSTIPILYSQRGTATFNAAAGSQWASMALNLDDPLTRQVMELDCNQISIDKVINGFYNVDSQGRFRAFLKDQEGSLTGAYHPDGDYFTAVSYDGPNRMYIMLGVRGTGTAAPNLIPSGSSSSYSYGRYINRILVNRYNPPPTNADGLSYMSELGELQFSSTQLIALANDTDIVTISNPMGDNGTPGSGGAVYLTIGGTNTAGINVAAHAGGRIEIQGTNFGLAGAATADGNTAIFMSDTGSSNVNSKSCPTIVGYSVGLRGDPSITDQDIQGTYYVAAMGDTGFSNLNPGRATYRLSSGTVTFDGQGGGHLTLAESDEGDVKAQDQDITYVLRNNVSVPPDSGTKTAKYTIVDLYKSPGDLNPMASAVVGNAGQDMIFYEDLSTLTYSSGSGFSLDANPVRLMGFAIRRND